MSDHIPTESTHTHTHTHTHNFPHTQQQMRNTDITMNIPHRHAHLHVIAVLDMPSDRPLQFDVVFFGLGGAVALEQVMNAMSRRQGRVMKCMSDCVNAHAQHARHKQHDALFL